MSASGEATAGQLRDALRHAGSRLRALAGPPPGSALPKALPVTESGGEPPF